MALNDAALTVGATAIKNAITHVQAYSAATNAGGTTNAVGSRLAVTGSVDSDGDITIAGMFTGLSASQAVYSVGYWSASSGGTFYGERPITSGDTAANSSGEFSFSLTETGTAA
jgi:hypothetical protein